MLEVGCGRGDLAAALVQRGHEVVALDLKLHEDRPAGPTYVEGDFLTFEASEKFDALLFSQSLHHISPLDLAIERAEAALVPGGGLVVDDFDLAAVTPKTARWLYEQLAELEGHGGHEGHEGHHPDGPDEPSPIEKWQKHHEHEPPLHTAAQMDEAIRRRFHVSLYGVSQYLYSYFPPDKQHAMHVHEIQAILRRTIVPLARRWVAYLETAAPVDADAETEGASES